MSKSRSAAGKKKGAAGVKRGRATRGGSANEQRGGFVLSSLKWALSRKPAGQTAVTFAPREWTLGTLQAWARARLFISYAREDRGVAEAIYRSVSAAGFDAYLDTEGTLTGERFDAVIVQQLRRADGVIAILSAHSAASAWCQAELCYAHALQTPIAPVRVGPDPVDLPEPLGWLQRPLQHLAIGDASRQDEVMRRLSHDLRLARRRRRNRVLRNLAAGAAAVVAVAGGWIATTRALNSASRERERASIVEAVGRTDKTLQRARVESLSSNLRDDPSLIQRLRTISENPESTDVQRINAMMLVNALTTSRDPRNRWYVRDVDWADAELSGASFSAVTFQGGTIRQVRFVNTYFGGVVWNQSPLNGRPGLMLSRVRFTRSRFDGGEFSGTGGVDVVFVNSHFTGTRLAVENLSATVFKSESRDSPPGVITDEISVFDRAVIERCVPPPDPKVLYIVPPGSEVTFDGVVFEGVQFRGAIRATWFKNCHFSNCVLPRHLTESELSKQGNLVQSSVWRDMSC
jgi:uncharacterized protein YjbI with pentapeptide repeats